MKRKIYQIPVFLFILAALNGCILLPPQEMTVRQITKTSVIVSWKIKLLIAEYVLLERMTDRGEFEQIASLPMEVKNNWSYTDTNLQTGMKYTYRVRLSYEQQFSKYSNEASIIMSENPPEDSFVIDHNCAKLALIPQQWILEAKSKLHIAYQHTSHGSQITTGMTGLAEWKGSLYSYNTGGTGGSLDLRDCPISSYQDLGYPDRTSWATSTRSYLNTHSDTNVIMWSWCSQVSYSSEEEINTYLNLMNQLEIDYPNVKFVYMTGHQDSAGFTGNLYFRNEQISNYCRANNKILYDFADIERYDPDGIDYLPFNVTDACDYYKNGSWNNNWAIEWQSSHIKGIDWYECESAHSQPLNANLKAYAAWWMFARLSGWNGQ